MRWRVSVGSWASIVLTSNAVTAPSANVATTDIIFIALRLLSCAVSRRARPVAEDPVHRAALRARGEDTPADPIRVDCHAHETDCRPGTRAMGRHGACRRRGTGVHAMAGRPRGDAGPQAGICVLAAHLHYP